MIASLSLKVGLVPRGVGARMVSSLGLAAVLPTCFRRGNFNPMVSFHWCNEPPLGLNDLERPRSSDDQCLGAGGNR